MHINCYVIIYFVLVFMLFYYTKRTANLLKIQFLRIQHMGVSKLTPISSNFFEYLRVKMFMFDNNLIRCMTLSQYLCR